MKLRHRFVLTLGLLVLGVSLLTPASFADTKEPITDWMEKIEASYLDQTYIDMDGAYLGQCVDLIFFYASEIFPEENFRQTIRLGNADATFFGANKDYFEAIPFDGSAPQVGDIICWPYWYLGHVAVVTEVKGDTITYYEQNSNSTGTAPVTQGTTKAPLFDYYGFQPFGYLRPILSDKTEVPPVSNMIEQQH